MFYLVNPSDLPNKKSRRRNPELLIVNPYKLEKGNNGRNQMAKNKNRRKNPLARRRNPAIVETAKEVVSKENLKVVAAQAVGGGLALTLGTLLVGSRLGGLGAVGRAAVTVASGIGGAIILSQIGDRLAGKVPHAQLLSAMAMPVATGAMVIGGWELARPVAEALVAKARTAAGLGSWTKEFPGLGQTYWDEFPKGIAPGMDGLGQNVIPHFKPEDNLFLSGYEPMGDVYNSGRLGSFEAESGFGGFVPEAANGRDQQVADQMKAAAGAFDCGLGQDPSTLFEPFIQG